MKEGSVVSVGTFDGIHLGHQAILDEVRRQAHHEGLPSAAVAFSSPPRWTLHDKRGRYLLLPPAAKLNLLARFVDHVVPASFLDVRFMSPEEFAKAILTGQRHARVVVEGQSFRFGHDRSGDMQTLVALGKTMGFDVVTVPPVKLHGRAVSSTRIREAVQSSDFETAQQFLGRPPILLGTVSHGDRVGHQLGYPTANLDVSPSVLLPQNGVFLVHAFTGSTCSTGLLYIGTRPTFHGQTLRCEVHLLDAPSDSLYGEKMEIHFLERIRDDLTLPSMEALRDQIATDIASARDREADYPRATALFVS